MPFPVAALLPVLQQTAPLIVLILVPLFALRVFAFLRPRLGFLARLLALGMALLGWLWGSSSSPAVSLEDSFVDERRKKGGRVRTRADQVAEANRNKHKSAASSGMQNGSAAGNGDVAVVDAKDARFPGLVNMSGTHCFMNSTLQALASLHTLPPYLLAIRARAEATDVPTPVVDSLLDLLAQLNTPSSSPSSSAYTSGGALRPVALVEALCTPLVCAPTTSELDVYRPSASSSTKDATTANNNFSSALTAFWDARGAATVSTSSTKATALLASHEHQDAQELFQLLSECVREEAGRVGREGGGRGLALASPNPNSNPAASTIAFPSGVGLAAALDDNTEHTNTDETWHPPPSPFDGLTATRRACVRCGYTAAIRHFSFDSVQLALDLGGGGGWGGTSLPALLAAYTTLEVLQDCPCRRCALRATARRLADEVAKLESGASEPQQVNGMTVTAGNGHVHADEEKPSSSHKSKKGKHDGEKEREGDKPTASRLRRLKAVRRMEARVRWALEAGRIEEEELEGEWDSLESGGGSLLKSGTGGDALKGVRIERVAGGVCTRQSMLGRPPPILALHINRSVHTGMRTVKNSARVAFPELLDLGPYTTGGVMNLDPTTALSGTGGGDSLAGWHGGNEGKKAKAGAAEECMYRLSAVVCHYGQHAFGHYVCYRRAPVPVSSTPTAVAFSADSTHAPAPPTHESSAGTGTGWLRISDARVDRVGVEAVLEEGSAVFMLYYERVVGAAPSSATITSTPGMTASASAPLASHPRASTPSSTPTPTLPISTSMPSLPTVTAVYAGAADGEADSEETLKPGQFASSSGSAGSWGCASAGGGTGRMGMAGLLGASPKARVVRSVSLGMGLGRAGSSVSSLRSVSPASSSSASFVSVASPGEEEAPGTPRVRAQAVDVGKGEEEVEALALSVEKADGEREENTLPTPPPTPRSTMSPSPLSPSAPASPSPTKTTQKRKKKKNKGGKAE
ncbi:hypothetical protein C8R46DRAFT_1191891 [Mycena filopes]|nr:hypothetical protein C8R46DRAFT_1191891 [Mycena filopes]